jgi:hypothetical protein
MGYGIKYELLCTSKKSNLYKAKIYKDDVVLGNIDRNVPLNPFVLRKDRASVIKGTSFEFAIREAVDFEFIPFYTSNPKKYKVEVYKDTVMLWVGYIDPQQYNAPYKPAPNNIRFTASDGLGLLKNEDFTLTGRQTELDIIRYCLDKIGLGLSYAIAISIWETGHDTTRSPLAQSYLNCEIFDGDSCYEVIEKVLSRYDAEISQWKGRWHIISSRDKKTTRMVYTSEGVYDTTISAPDVLTFGYPHEGADVYPPNNILNHSLEPGGNRVRLSYNYGTRESMLLNYLFELYASAMFTDWTKTGSFNVYQYFKSGEFFAFLQGYANSDDFYIAQSIDVVNVSGEDFVFEIDACPYGRQWSGSYSGMDTVNMEVRVLITLAVGATTWYLTNTGWSTTPGYLTQTITAAKYLEELVWTTITVITSEIPGDGTLTIRLQRYKSASPGSGVYLLGVFFHKPRFRFLDNGEPYDDRMEGEAVFDDSVELTPLDDITVAAGDAPDMPNNNLMYDNCVFHSDDSVTSGWKFATGDSVHTLVQAYLKLLASRNRMPRQTLTGNIKGTSIEFNSLIKHAYNSDREFELAECKWDMYEETFNATLLEVLPFSDEDITFTDDDGTVTIITEADLTVASVALGTNPVNTEAAFNITVHVDNTGDLPGQNTIQWKVVNGADETISSGTHESQIIAASDDDDDVIEITAPDTEGNYYVKAKMIEDSSWVSSAALTVAATSVIINSIDTIPAGEASSSMPVTFNVTNSGAAGSKNIVYECYDEYDELVFEGSQAKTFANGTDDYSLTGLTYPATPGTGYYLTLYIEGAGGLSVDSNDFEVTS